MVIAVAFLTALVFGMTPDPASAWESVETFADLQSKIAAYGDATEDVIIAVSKDILITSGLTIPGNPNDKTLTIKSADAVNPVTLTRGVDYGLFAVTDGAKMVLEDIVIDGNKDAYADNWGSLIYVRGGEFTMNSGEITGNSAQWSGGGVEVYNGTFIMNGGKITDNSAMYGGGVNVGIDGVFIMNGGEISGNTALGGGVYIDAGGPKFDMFDEEISDNGGGFNVGEFTMNGGKISDNDGVGVYVDGDADEYGNGRLTLGGTAVVRGNANNNVYLPLGGYITLSTEKPPAHGMAVWVTKTGDDGVIVESGANPGDAAYFFADESDKSVMHGGGQLIIVDVAFDDPGFIYGDVDGDGYISMADALLLARRLANWSDIDINEDAADVDNDGSITLLDLLVLLRHLANWTGYETLPWLQQQESPAEAVLSAQPAVPFSEPDLEIIGYTMVENKRVTMREYDYTYVVHVKNNGGAAENLKARIVGSSESVTVEGDVDLTFGNVAEGATATSGETFTIRRLMTAENTDANLVFAFDYDRP